MKYTLGIGTLVVGLLTFGFAYLPVQGALKASSLCGGCGSCPTAPATQAANLVSGPGAVVLSDTPAATQPVDVANKKCLVEPKEDVAAEGATCTYEGKIYHFCCKDCVKTFKGDPVKYLKDLAENPEKYGIKK